MATNLTKLEMLEMPCWTYHEVMAYCHVKKSKAFEIIKVCKEQLNGSVRFEKHLVKRDSVLAYLQTDIEREMYMLRTLTKTDDMT